MMDISNLLFVKSKRHCENRILGNTLEKCHLSVKIFNKSPLLLFLVKKICSIEKMVKKMKKRKRLDPLCFPRFHHYGGVSES